MDGEGPAVTMQVKTGDQNGISSDFMGSFALKRWLDVIDAKPREVDARSKDYRSFQDVLAGKANGGLALYWYRRVDRVEGSTQT